jgi:hypothetical protein
MKEKKAIALRVEASEIDKTWTLGIVS